MKELNKAAQVLGRLGKGKPKNYSKEELERRSTRMILLNKARQKKDDSQNIKA